MTARPTARCSSLQRGPRRSPFRALLLLPWVGETAIEVLPSQEGVGPFGQQLQSEWPVLPARSRKLALVVVEVGEESVAVAHCLGEFRGGWSRNREGADVPEVELLGVALSQPASGVEGRRLMAGLLRGISGVHTIGVDPDLQYGQPSAEVAVDPADLVVMCGDPGEVVHVASGRGSVQSRDLPGEALPHPDRLKLGQRRIAIGRVDAHRHRTATHRTHPHHGRHVELARQI